MAVSAGSLAETATNGAKLPRWRQWRCAWRQLLGGGAKSVVAPIVGWWRQLLGGGANSAGRGGANWVLGVAPIVGWWRQAPTTLMMVKVWKSFMHKTYVCFMSRYMED